MIKKNVLLLMLSLLNTTFIYNVSSCKINYFFKIPMNAYECILHFTNAPPSKKRNSRSRSLRNATKRRRKRRNSTKDCQDQDAEVNDIIPYIETIPYNSYTLWDH